MKSHEQWSESGKQEQERQSTKPITFKEAYKKLSLRESEVLELLIEGKSNRQIAESLYISVDTVENHITRIGAKLGLQGRGKVRRWAQIQFDNQ
jgi:DNA-binding NarL/FixJ family response regulator